MASRGTRTWEDELDTLMALAARLEDAKADDLALSGAEFGDVIRHLPGKRLILRGTLGDRAVIFRMGLQDESDAHARTFAEMRRLWPYMCEGDFRIAEPLHFNADHDLLVIGEVTGTPLMHYMRKTSGPDRTRYLDPAARWYRQATAMTEGHRVANSRGWLKRAIQASARQPFPELKALEDRIIPHLHTLADRIHGAEWRTAICHGDLHPNNLLADGDRLTGIDFGGSSRLPIYKDMARFLMHMGRRRLIPSETSWMGVDAAAAQAMADAFGLDGTERGVILPFMLGVEALIRVESTELPRSRVKRAERMYRALLRGLAAAA